MSFPCKALFSARASLDHRCYAAAILQGDQELLRFLNTWVFLRAQDGTLAEIYERYTGVKLGALLVF